MAQHPVARFCVVYLCGDGTQYVRACDQEIGETYDAFVQRVQHPGFDFPHKLDCIMDLLSGVKRGLLPASVL